MGGFGGWSWLVLVATFVAQAGLDDARAVRSWLQSQALPLTAVEAGRGLDDVAPLADVMGDARVVGLGFAAPGGRELFQVGHRLLECAVVRHGFTVLALGTSLPDCQALDEYILHGTGDPEASLHAQGYWTWDNESILGVVRWMHEYNADPLHQRKLRLYGLDMQNAGPALDKATEYLRRSGSVSADDLARRLEALRGLEIFRVYPSWPDEQRDELMLAAEGLVSRFEARRAEMIEGSSLRSWELARRHAMIVRQNEGWVRAHFARAANGESVSSVRGRAMAANAAWILEREGSEARMLVWAHNADVSRLPVGDATAAEATLGRELSVALGDAYRAIAVTFGRGTIQAIHSPVEWKPDLVQSLQPHRVADATPGQVESMLASLAGPGSVLDLRAGPNDGPVRRWLDQPHPMWFLGSGYSDERAVRGDYVVPVVLPRHFDAMIFIDSIGPAQPNRRTRERFDSPAP